jgi:hypothetical protein
VEERRFSAASSDGKTFGFSVRENGCRPSGTRANFPLTLGRAFTYRRFAAGFVLNPLDRARSDGALTHTLQPLRFYAMDAGFVISNCGSNFTVVPKARETRHNFSARLSSSRARSRSSAEAIFRFGRTTICVKL